MKVLFFYTIKDSPPIPSKPLRSWGDIQMGISYISSFLKTFGCNTKLIVLHHTNFENEVERIIQEYLPDMICFTSVASEYFYVCKIARYIRNKLPNVYMIIGGPHASLQPQEVLEGPFDAVCVSEGEYPVKELAVILQSGEVPCQIPNLWIKKDNTIVRNETRSFFQDLDEIPIPDREMWRPWVENDSSHMILVARGCPYNCTYCSNHILRNLSKGKYVRFRSPQNVMREIHLLCEEFPSVSEVYFEVETITANQKWAFELCDLLEGFNATRDKPLTFGTNIRAMRNKSLKQLFGAFVKAGFRFINMGIESGSERVRNQVLFRKEKDSDIVHTCDEAHEAGLSVNVYNLIGLPGETPEDFKKTIKINRRCLPEGNYLSIFYPYPGTELYRVCMERGIKAGFHEEILERVVPVLGLPEFPNRKVKHYFRWFDWYVYRGKRPVLRLLFSVFFKTLQAHPKLLRIYRSISTNAVFYALKKMILKKD